jgi:hypothetical protein
MKKTTKKLTAIMAAMLTVASVGATAAMPVFAETVANGSVAANVVTYNDRKTELEFSKTLNVDDNGQVMPNETFNFVIKPSTVTNSGSADNLVNGMVLYSGVDFTETDTNKDNYDSTNKGIKASIEFTNADTVTVANGQASTTKTAKFNIADGLTFSHVGVYRYEVVEVTPAEGAQDVVKDMTYDTVTRYVDLYVLSEKVDGVDTYYVAAITSVTGNTDTKEPIEFKNTCDTGKLTVTKHMTGLTDNTSEFTFTVTIKPSAELVAGTVLKAYKTSGTTTDTANPIEIKVGTATTITLKHNESFDITGLFTDTEYEVQETAASGAKALADYTTTISKTAAGTVTDATNDERKDSGKMTTQNVTDVYNNYSSPTVSTGIALTITPIAIAGGLAAAGAILVVTKRKLKK